MSRAMDAIDPLAAALPNEPHFSISDDGVMTVLPAWPRNDITTILRLLMVNIEVDESTVAGWTDVQCQEAEIYALSASFSASDNDDIQVPAKPSFLPAERRRNYVATID